MQFPYIISIGKCAKSLIESSNFDTSIIRVKDFVTLRPHTLLLRPPWQKSQSRWPCSAYLRQQPFTLFSWIFFGDIFHIFFEGILKDAPAGEHHHGDKGEGDGGLPDLDLVRAVDHEDDQKPDVGEHGEDHRDAEDGEGLDPASLPVRNHDNAGVERRINPINTLPIKEIEAIKTVAAVIESLNICFSKKEDNHDNLTLLTRHT